MKLTDQKIWKNLARLLKFSCIEDDIDARLSEDDGPIKPEDPSQPAPNHRPPSYNPEDYAHAISKYAKSSNIYAQDQREKKVKKEKSNGKDGQEEMALKQFASLPELLRRLREDLKTAYLSFVKELVRGPHDCVTLLLDLLKMIQLAQASLNGKTSNREQQIALRRALIDEFECLSCLRCCLRSSEAPSRLSNYKSGLYCLASATMSSLTRSRTLALQLLTKSCEGSCNGHQQVLEAFSTLRLRYSEPVRYKFLVSMMLSHPHPSFQVWSLRFINALVNSSDTLRAKIYLQEELAEAGFDTIGIKKALEHRGSATQLQQDAVVDELEKWSKGYIDINTIEDQLVMLRSANSSLKHELSSLRQANSKLLEENVLLRAVGGEVEERCAALKRRLEHYGISSAPSPVPSMTDSEVSSFATVENTIKRNESPKRNSNNKRNSTPTEENPIDIKNERQSPSPDWNLSSFIYQEAECIRAPPIPKKRQVLNTDTNTYSIKKPEYQVKELKLSGRSREEASRILKEAQGNINMLNNIIHKSNESPEGRGKLSSSNNSFDSEDEMKRERKSSSPVNKDKEMTKIEVLNPSNFEKRNASPTSKPSSSLNSSTSSLSQSSSSSLAGAKRTDNEKVNEQRLQSSIKEDREVDYERDHLVYEAVAKGNDTILYDKNSTNSSNGSGKSKASNKSAKSGNNHFEKLPSVRQSVRLYEKMMNGNDIIEYAECDNPISNTDIKITEFTSSSENVFKDNIVSEKEVEDVMNGLENVIRNAESSLTPGIVKANPLCQQMNNDQSFSSSSSDEIAPPLPPRSRSRGTSSQSSRGRTPDSDPVINMIENSPIESSDSESNNQLTHFPPNSRSLETETSHSFGWVKGNAAQKKLETHEEYNGHISRKQLVRRSESLHTNISEYNSHKSYSPQRNSPTNRLKPLRENEININGRTYTKYTASEFENKHRSRDHAYKMKRRRNRSIDDRLDYRYKDHYGDYCDESDPNYRYAKKFCNNLDGYRSRSKDVERIKTNSGKMFKSSKPLSRNELHAFNGFRNPVTYNNMDYGSNFVLSSKHNRHGEFINEFIDFSSHGRRRSKSSLDIRCKIIEDPQIPTPDYSSTPAGTLTHPVSGRHILEMPCGLY